MSRATIAIDIDDVLADNAAGFVAFSNEMWGTSLRPEDYDEHWAKIWQVDTDEAERRAAHFHQSGVLSRYKQTDAALPVLRRLSRDYKLIIVTSRRLEVRRDTLKWIHQHYPGIFEDEAIHFAGIWDAADKHAIRRTKAEVIERLGADYLIDDQIKHCLAVAAQGRRALLFGNYSWNQMSVLPDNVMRVADWPALERYFYEDNS